MPHVILEHNISDKEKISNLCKLLHQKLCEQETVKPETVKARSIYVENVLAGANAKPTLFMHAEVKLLPGRSVEIKNKISEEILGVLKSQKLDAILSAELTELNSYSKYP